MGVRSGEASSPSLWSNSPSIHAFQWQRDSCRTRPVLLEQKVIQVFQERDADTLTFLEPLWEVSGSKWGTTTSKSSSTASRILRSTSKLLLTATRKLIFFTRKLMTKQTLHWLEKITFAIKFDWNILELWSRQKLSKDATSLWTRWSLEDCHRIVLLSFLLQNKFSETKPCSWKRGILYGMEMYMHGFQLDASWTSNTFYPILYL